MVFVLVVVFVFDRLLYPSGHPPHGDPASTLVFFHGELDIFNLRYVAILGLASCLLEGVRFPNPSSHVSSLEFYAGLKSGPFYPIPDPLNKNACLCVTWFFFHDQTPTRISILTKKTTPAEVLTISPAEILTKTPAAGYFESSSA